jgi:lipopolysaccharide/colanic/teichoic acid biosynthesis glycosyltransferase
MSLSKRLLDLALIALLAPFAVPVLLVATALVALSDGRPVLFGSERIGRGGRPFTLWKLRTMRPDCGDSGVSGGDKAARITRVGRVLRRCRIDEAPQLWNIVLGEMSLVGPRPPLRTYVERFPEIYARVLAIVPGVTGLATLVFHRREEALLAACATAAETDAVYVRRCVPVKARLDLIYLRRRSLWLDLWLIGATAWRLLCRPGAPRQGEAGQVTSTGFGGGAAAQTDAGYGAADLNGRGFSEPPSPSRSANIGRR